ncbi:MAG: response regulator transcription factor [Eubacteriales bacterium]|nr:response regulator transcription factor [Eubacteriales bacterium]
MYRLLLVDDEDQIRDGLKRILKWEEYGIVICGEASDGGEALQRIEEMQPDIVLTDIKMPGMDGIALLKEVKRRGYKVHMLVLSGYDDFSLVRQAMKQGAVDYLLKPVGKTELIQSIEEVLDDPVDSIDQAKSNFLNRLITNSISAMEFREKKELLELGFGTGPMAIARLESRNNTGLEENDSGDLLAACRIYMEETGSGIAFANTAGRIVLLLTGLSDNQEDLGCGTVLRRMLDCLQADREQELFLAVSRPVRSHRGLSRAYREAEHALSYTFIFDRQQILFQSEIDRYLTQEEADFAIEPKQIEELVRDGSSDAIEQYLQQLFSQERMQRYCVDHYILKNAGMELIIYVYHFLLQQTLADRKGISEEKEETLRDLQECGSAHAMIQLLQNCMKQAAERCRKDNGTSYSRIVAETIDRIRREYSDEDLSLQYLAEEFHSNTAYLGRIFKKETGSSFADYLNLYRIEEAKKLLRDTNLKGSELCKRVGFSNYNYFYIVFKKLTGMKPTELRNSQFDPVQ